LGFGFVGSAKKSITLAVGLSVDWKHILINYVTLSEVSVKNQIITYVKKNTSIVNLYNDI
jgi:hypothetical protein